MLRVYLSDSDRSALSNTRRTALPPRVRDRVEMILLSAAGWSPPAIAAHLGCCPQTVRTVIHGFAARGAAALYPRRPGPAPDVARREHVSGRLRELLAQDRTWTARQLADALRPGGPAIGPRQVRRYLAGIDASYRRTASTLEHKQDRPAVERAAGVLGGLENRAAGGRLKLYYLDEVGFSPSLPTGYSWCLPGRRKRVRYEYPQGRRVNALAAYRPTGRRPWIGARAFERTITSDDLLAYLRSLPWAAVPRVVVLDNAGIHTSRAVKAARPGLAAAGIYLYYLPAYSPELNRVEGVFKQVKHHDIPTRSYATRADLRAAVEDGFLEFHMRLGRPRK